MQNREAGIGAVRAGQDGTGAGQGECASAGSAPGTACSTGDGGATAGLRPNLFVATYLVNRGLHKPAVTSPVAHAFFHAHSRASSGFPYDAADDPSFFCAQHLSGPVSWGVCRTDVRNQVAPGDWVAFFSAEKLRDSTDIEYRFVAALRVAARLSAHSLPPPFDDYLNRLVEFDPGTFQWKHAEPALAQKDWHVDWLWRVSSSPAGQKSRFLHLGATDTVAGAHWQQPGADGKNYVVFAQDVGFVLEQPPIVAHKRGGFGQEVWLPKPETRHFRDVVFGPGAIRWLRTHNRQQPHRHVKRALANPDGWVVAVESLARRL